MPYIKINRDPNLQRTEFEREIYKEKKKSTLCLSPKRMEQEIKQVVVVMEEPPSKNQPRQKEEVKRRNKKNSSEEKWTDYPFDSWSFWAYIIRTLRKKLPPKNRLYNKISPDKK